MFPCWYNTINYYWDTILALPPPLPHMLWDSEWQTDNLLLSQGSLCLCYLGLKILIVKTLLSITFVTWRLVWSKLCFTNIPINKLKKMKFNKCSLRLIPLHPPNHWGPFRVFKAKSYTKHTGLNLHLPTSEGGFTGTGHLHCIKELISN